MPTHKNDQREVTHGRASQTTYRYNARPGPRTQLLTTSRSTKRQLLNHTVHSATVTTSKPYTKIMIEMPQRYGTHGWGSALKRPCLREMSPRRHSRDDGCSYVTQMRRARMRGEMENGGTTEVTYREARPPAQTKVALRQPTRLHMAQRAPCITPYICYDSSL